MCLSVYQISHVPIKKKSNYYAESFVFIAESIKQATRPV